MLRRICRNSVEIAETHPQVMMVQAGRQVMEGGVAEQLAYNQEYLFVPDFKFTRKCVSV